jgi:hypothetical protein
LCVDTLVVEGKWLSLLTSPTIVLEIRVERLTRLGSLMLSSLVRMRLAAALALVGRAADGLRVIMGPAPIRHTVVQLLNEFRASDMLQLLFDATPFLGLYQKKNCRCASLSLGDFAQNTGSRV